MSVNGLTYERALRFHGVDGGPRPTLHLPGSAADGFAFFCEVFVELFEGTELHFVAVVAAVEIAVVVFVAAADSGAVVVYFAHVVAGEVLAAIGDLDVPVVLLDEDTDALVGEVPANIIVIVLALGGVERQSKVATAKAGAFFTDVYDHRVLL